MTVEIYNKLKENPKHLEYLRNNSSWYKLINRDENNYYKMVEDMKDKLHLRVTDKVDNALNTMDIITKIIDIAK